MFTEEILKNSKEAAVHSCEECKHYVKLDNEGCNYFGEILNSLEPCKNAVKKNGC